MPKGDASPFGTGANDLYSDPATYWSNTGKIGHSDFISGNALVQGHGHNDPLDGASPAHFRQEARLVELLAAHLAFHSRTPNYLPPTSIFEAGCGRGRLAHLFERIYPQAHYVAVDVGPVQLEQARRLRPDGHYWVGDITSPDFYEAQKARDTHWVDYLDGYDLVVCSEVLMHIKPDNLWQAFSNLVALTRPRGHIVTIDWVPLPPDPLSQQAAPRAAFWNFAHDYGALFRSHPDITLGLSARTDSQMIFILERR